MRIASALLVLLTLCAGGTQSAPLMTYDTSASRLFAQASINSCTALTQAQKAAINQVIVQLKSNSLWTAYRWLNVPGMGADSCFGEINWIVPTESASQTGSVTTTGFRGVASDGSTGYWTTSVAANAATPATQNDARVGVWIQSFGGNTLCTATGAVTAANMRFLFRPAVSPTNIAARVYATSSATVTGPTPAKSLYAVDRSSSSTVDFYTDGASFSAGVSSTSTTGTADAMTEMLQGTTFSLAGCVYGMFSISSHFTAGQEATAYTIWSQAFTWAGAQ